MMKFSLATFALAASFALGAPVLAQTRPAQRPAPNAVKIAPADASARKAARIDRAFRNADRNRDNAVTRTEYRDWYKVAARRRGPLTWQRHANQVFKQLDTISDGRLTRAEFGADPSFLRVRPGWGGAYAGKGADDADYTAQ